MQLEVRTLTEQIAERLREDVLRGRYDAGQRLSQESIARRFHVSRIPVRDALKVLENEGLVLTHPRFGTTVAGLSAADLNELYEMRLALEPALVRIATARIGEQEIAQLIRQLEGMGRPRITQDAWLKAHRSFHDTLNGCAALPRMRAAVDALRAQTERYLRLYRDVDEHADDLTADHRPIVDAIARRDGDAAALATREHMERVRDRLLTYLDDRNGDRT